MRLYESILNGEEKISVVGLGYVGMPLAIAFDKVAQVIGYDLSKEKISDYRKGIDPTNEVGNDAIRNAEVVFTNEESYLAEAKFHVVAVPTPINLDKTPDLAPVISATETVGRNLTKGSIVVYESTVYPGVTEDVCIPLLEKTSGLIAGTDFKVGYSPERINPGDKVNRLENIVKIVAGMDDESTEIIAKVYELIILAGVHKVNSIKVAEAAKVVENSQRDINIAFMNELAMVFDKMDIDTNEVIEAMNTKWNALKFYPGLVGGHCIGVDPYYFIYEAEKLGYHSQIILSGRKINDGMANFVVENIIKKLVLTNKKVKSSRVAILGATFKENCPDIRNSKVKDIVCGLKNYGIEPILIDPYADSEEIEKEFSIPLSSKHDLINLDCLIVAVSHDEYKELSLEKLDKFFKNIPNNEKVIVDIKGIFDKEEIENKGYSIWRL